MTIRDICLSGVSVIALAGAIGMSIQPSAAQQAEKSFGAIEEITITATRREVGLQDVGVSVTAFSGASLREMNVTTTDDLTIVTPGLSFIQAGGAPLAGLIAIRGVAQNDFAAHLESANVLYIDDVYRPSNGSSLRTMFDVERVEVLKGPQGTLFGRNATGGLIHIITKEPTQDLEGYASLTVGEYEKITGEAAINLPMSDKAALRVAAYANHNDGWIKNAIGPDQMADDTLALRGKLLVTPAEGWRIKFQVEWAKNFDNPAGASFPTGGFVGPDTLGQFKPPPAPTDTGYVDADGSVFTGEFDFPGVFEREEFMIFADISYSWDNLTFTSITSYSDLDILYEEDNDLTPFDIAIFRQNTTQENFTQEFRVNGDYDRFRVTGGFYYLHIDGDYFQNYQINNLGNFNQILAPIPVLILPVGLNQFGDYTLKTKSWSLFAQAEYDVDEKVTVTAGLRYTRDKKDYAYINVCENLLPVPACPPAFPPDILAGAGLVTDEHSEGGVSARLQFDYRVSEDWLLFAAYNRGYKAFNYNAGFAGAAPVDGVRFDGEKLNAFEIGSKSDFWDGRARFNISGYYYDYQDYQAFDQRGTSFILSNTDATIYGADAEFTVSPGGGINALIGVAYIHTDVKDIPIGGQLFDVEAPQAPEFSINFAVSKDFQVGGGNVRIGFDGNYEGSYFSQLNNAPVTKAGDNWLVNARISYAPNDGNWEIAAFGRNLFNEERLLYAFDITFPGNGLVEQVYGKPQWFGGEFRINF